ncbi:MAG TPA: porin [Hydrogenophaga sp.]|nr:porin [Hydrogenophaga sp.]
MKKSIIALAALASLTAVGTAAAQSSVTLYGRMDASVGSERVDGVSTTKLYSGNLTTSRLGFRGSEDLGGGLKANFQLEAALSLDDGTTGGMRFNRASWVGLSGGFGAVRAGLLDSAYKDIYDMGNSANTFDSAFTPTGVAYAGVGNYTSRPSNHIRYDTPNFGGFSGGLSVALDETAGVSNDTNAVNLRYRAGGLDVGVGVQKQKNSVVADERDYRVLAAAYDFGVVRVSGQYQVAEQGSGLEDNEYAVGVTMPLGAFELSAGYAMGKSELSGVTTEEGKAFGLAATYALSKRTKLYGGYVDGEVENGVGTVTTDRRLFALGLRHDF